MTVIFSPKIYTIEEYLELEEKSQEKHEYRDGEIVPMTGGTTNHNEIAGNFYAYLKLMLKGQNYRIFFSDVRLWIPQYRQYTYPDVMVIQGKPIYSDQDTTTVMNPMIIIEVLSKSTLDYDKGTKFDYYRSLPQLQEYILIDQYKYSVQQFAKQDEHQWVLRELLGQEAILSLLSLNFKITFNELYENVDFADSD